MVVLLPAVIVNTSGMGDPFFCKYLCPQGVLEGAIPLSLTNAGIRAAWEAVQLEILHSAGSCGRQRGFLPPVLQMAVPLGGGLCTYESCIPVSDAR